MDEALPKLKAIIQHKKEWRAIVVNDSSTWGFDRVNKRNPFDFIDSKKKKYQFSSFEQVVDFRKSENDLIDIIFLGSSHCYCTIYPDVLWGNYGFSSFNLTVSAQDKDSTYYLLKEALKTPTVLVSVMHVNNEVGCINDINEITAIVANVTVVLRS